MDNQKRNVVIKQIGGLGIIGRGNTLEEAIVNAKLQDKPLTHIIVYIFKTNNWMIDKSGTIVWNNNDDLFKTFTTCVSGNERPIKESTQTPGNWITVEHTPNVTKICSESDPMGHREIARIFKDGRSDVEFRSNARLMAEAPKLLEFAEMLFDKLKTEGGEGSIVFNELIKTLTKIKER